MLHSFSEQSVSRQHDTTAPRYLSSHPRTAHTTPHTSLIQHFSHLVSTAPFIFCTLSSTMSLSMLSSPSPPSSDDTASIASDAPTRGTLPTDVDAATGVVLIQSEDLPASTPIVQGPSFSSPFTLDSLLSSFLTTGFQATNLGLAVQEVNKMITWRLSHEPLPEGETEAEQPVPRSTVRCTVFLAYTSNMVSSGVREVIRYLVQHRMVDVLITTCGGIEEDIMKCLHPHFIGDFHLDGATLRRKGQNRIGNLIVPNKNYVAFEAFLTPLLDSMVERQVKDNVIQSPASFIREMGKAINDESSIYYWAYKNQIPVFSPALTDGSIGDMIFFHSSANTTPVPLILDIAADIRHLNDIALLADHSGQIILGGGLAKHHCCNANLMRNGADYSVYINTGVEYDGSDAGASPDEAVSWGKIRMGATPVKVWADATIAFPLLVSQTFAKLHPNSPTKEAATGEGKDGKAANGKH